MREIDETLLFLPGAGGDVTMWRSVGEGLRHPGRRQYLGWPGFGGVPADPQVRGIRDLAARVVAAMSGPVVLCAQSMGGVVALLAALERPQLVRRLVLAVTSGGIDLRAAGAHDWRPDFRRAFPDVPTWFEDERWDLRSRLAGIAIPTLLLWGDADPISPVAVGQTLAGLLPRAELVVVRGGGHDLVRTHADEIVPHIDRHLERDGG